MPDFALANKLEKTNPVKKSTQITMKINSSTLYINALIRIENK
jgi:hypothetical protein